MVNAHPASGHARGDVFLPIIDENNFLTRDAGQALDNLIELLIRLHCPVFVRENVAVEVSEKREAATNMPDCQIVGVRENESRDLPGAQLALQLDHRLDRLKNIGKERTELIESAAKAGRHADLAKELLPADFAGFITKKETRMVDEFLDLTG